MTDKLKSELALELQDIKDTLEEVQDYFSNKSDADHDGEGYIPNEEMRMENKLDRIQGLLTKISKEVASV